MSAVAQFRVLEIIRLQHGPSIIFAGQIVAGGIRSGMDIFFELQDRLYCSCRIIGVEYMDRISVGETLVALRCEELSEKDVDFYDALCPPGTVVEIREAETRAANS